MPCITLTPEVAAKFKELLVQEADENAVFRIKEVKIGGGWKSHLELRVSMDEREDPDEECEVSVNDLPFVISNEVIDSYGEKYSIAPLECGTLRVTAGWSSTTAPE